MKKKIIIGIIITVILSLTAFGTIYAYQKEQSKLESNTVQGKHNMDQYAAGPGKNYDEYAFQSEQDCPWSKERSISNLRMREQNSPECEYEGGEENRYQHRYEDQYSVKEHNDCEGGYEKDRQFKNQDDNSHNRKETR